jgi:dTDP-4-amino-4,6-dideoxygalactose transaminase
MISSISSSGGPSTAPIVPLSSSPVGVPLLDLHRQQRQIEPEIQAAIEQICRSGRYVLGPECEQLEQTVARYSQARFGIACASGSDALLLALMAIDLKAGEEVLLPSYTFFATASAVWRLGARPIFVDIDPATYNLDPADVAKKITSRTKAIIPVHLFGQCAAMDELGKLAKSHKLTIIEDAAQAIGAEYHGRRAGSIGHIGCFSFYPTKNLGCAGDGGMLTTNDEKLAAKLKLLRGHGMEPRYYHQVVGINSRLDTIQAAILNVKLPHLDRWSEQRQLNAERYQQLFAAAGLGQFIQLPSARSADRHVWNQFVIRVAADKRDALRAYLAGQKIGTEIYYPVPLHLQQCFASLGYRPGDLPNSEQAAKETIALPIFPELTAAEQRTVVENIAGFFGLPTALFQSPISAPNYLKRSSI